MSASCTAGRLAAELPGEDGRLLALLLAGNPDQRGRHVSAQALANAMCQLGHRVGPTTIKDHRAGRCICATAGEDGTT